jgi:uncharacterized protein (UPF0147 family)
MANEFDDDIIIESDLPSDYDWRTAITPKTMLEPIEASVLGAVDTLSLGTADEIAAGLGSIGQEDPQAYEKLLDEVRQKQQELQQKQPIPTLIGKLAGGVPAGVAGASLTAGIAKTAPQIAAQIAKGAAVGGGLAGAQAFGSATGGFENRLEEAKDPALYGTLIGGAGPALSALLGRVRDGISTTPEQALVDPKVAGQVQTTVEPPGFFKTAGIHFKRGYETGESTIDKGRKAAKVVTDVAEETATTLKRRVNQIENTLRQQLEKSNAPVDVREAFSEAAAKLDDLSSSAIVDDQRIIDQYKLRLMDAFEKLSPKTPVKDIAKLSTDLGRYGTATSEAARLQTGAPKVIDDLTKSVDESITKAFGPEYAEAKTKQNALLSALEKLKINPRKVKYNEKLQQIIKEDQILDPFESIIKRTVNDPAASQQLDEAVELMRVADPALAQKMRDRLAFATKEFKVLQEGTELPVPATATARTIPFRIESGAAQVSNVAGRVLGKSAKIVGDAAVGGPILKKLIDSPNLPENYRRVLQQILESPEIKRKAVMFNLMQQPQFREAVKKESENDPDLQKYLDEDVIPE